MFASKLPQTGISIFTQMSALAAEHGAVNLSQGFPDFEIDSELTKYVHEALTENQVQYAPMAGRIDLRSAISEKIKAFRNIEINPDSEITITSGATQAIYTAITTVVQPGDEVILFDPAYDCYAPAITINQGIPIHLKLQHPTYHINWEEVNQKVNEKTRLIILNNPHNPTGTVLQKSDFEALEKLVAKHQSLLILSDEVYEFIQFEGRHLSVLDFPNLRSRSFVTYSFGKTLHVTGWKIGYCIAPPFFTAEFRKIHQYLVFCANNTIQYAITRYLNHTDLSGIANMYRNKRDHFLSLIQTSRFKILPCSGTYFCLLDYSAICSENDVDFAKRLTTEFGVAVIPISVFYTDQTDHKIVRICFAKKEETLTKAALKLCQI
jgi:methionine aminotransferase